jgi:hypothetical protein
MASVTRPIPPLVSPPKGWDECAAVAEHLANLVARSVGDADVPGLRRGVDDIRTELLDPSGRHDPTSLANVTASVLAGLVAHSPDVTRDDPMVIECLRTTGRSWNFALNAWWQLQARETDVNQDPAAIDDHARRTNPYLRDKAASSPHCPAQVLEMLSKDPSPLVRLSVAVNPRTPPEVFERLAREGGLMLDAIRNRDEHLYRQIVSAMEPRQATDRWIRDMRMQDRIEHLQLFPGVLLCAESDPKSDGSLGTTTCVAAAVVIMRVDVSGRGEWDVPLCRRHELTVDAPPDIRAEAHTRRDLSGRWYVTDS